MRIERINENKIRIFVTFDDLEERDIDLNSFNYNSPETQELFWDLMEQAELEFGFDTHESQLCIEAVSDIDQGFVITITKLDEEGEFESIQKFIKNRYRRNDLKVKKKSVNICSSLIIYNVLDFDDLCTLSMRVLDLFHGDSSVYRYQDEYYLVLSRIEGNISDPKLFDSIISEYGDKISNANFFEGYLAEHGQLLVSSSAIQVFAAL